MSRLHKSDRVKLISSLFSPEKSVIDRVIAQMAEIYGPIDWSSPEMFFDRTKYYAKEMGWPLHRRFVSFEELIGGNRRINIDPGYMSLERLILATGKNYIHRVYLTKGVYADLTLIFKRGGFRPLEWTYRDYSDPEMIECFNELRKNYMEKLRGIKFID